MKREEFDHIRADIRQAMLEGPQEDPTATPQILLRLLDAVGDLAVEWLFNPTRGNPRAWATNLLHDVQLRAVSKIPYGEPATTEPEDHRD